MDFTDDELRMVLDALSLLDIHGELDNEETAIMHSIRGKITEHFNPKRDK